MKFSVDIWFAPEDANAYKESGMLGCADEEHHFDTLEEAWEFYTTPRNVFHTQLTHYPNYELDEWGDGNVLAEGTGDNYTYVKGIVDSLTVGVRMIHSDDYIEGVEKGILMGYCEGCYHAYPLVDMNKYGMCEECELGLLPEGDEEE